MPKPRVICWGDIKEDMDISDAQRFGEIVELYQVGETRPNVFDPAFEEKVYRRLLRLNYDSKVDYFLVVGPIVPVFRVATVLGNYDDLVKVLIFNAQTKKYVAETINNGDNN